MIRRPGIAEHIEWRTFIKMDACIARVMNKIVEG